MAEKILVVDDEKVILDLTTMVLASKGYSVETVASGSEALERAKAIRPSLILLDYMMPGMDGLAVLKQLREKLPDSYVVMFTGKGSEELAVELMKAGASDYIRKPFNNHDLVDRIENVLRIRRIEIKNRELLEERERLLEEIAGWNCELEQRVAEKTRELNLVQAEIIQAEKLGTLGHLSAGIAHEIRNPLNSISLFAQVMKQRQEGDAEVGNYSDKIVSEIDRIDALLVKLLSVSESSIAETVVVDMSVTLSDALADFSSQFSLQNVELKLNLADNTPPIVANATDVEQVFNNLIANALQEMPDGGTLTVSMSFDERCVYIQFADSGAGIADEHLNRIFDPFFTAKPKGTGFGLSSVLRIVKNCSGRVAGSNRPEGGAIFSLEFPVKEC